MRVTLKMPPSSAPEDAWRVYGSHRNAPRWHPIPADWVTLDWEGRGAQKGPEGPFARLLSTDCLQNIRRTYVPGDRSLVAPWVWMTALH